MGGETFRDPSTSAPGLVSHARRCVGLFVASRSFSGFVGDSSARHGETLIGALREDIIVPRETHPSMWMTQ